MPQQQYQPYPQHVRNWDLDQRTDPIYKHKGKCRAWQGRLVCISLHLIWGSLIESQGTFRGDIAHVPNARVATSKMVQHVAQW